MGGGWSFLGGGSVIPRDVLTASPRGLPAARPRGAGDAVPLLGAFVPCGTLRPCLTETPMQGYGGNVFPGGFSYFGMSRLLIHHTTCTANYKC